MSNYSAENIKTYDDKKCIKIYPIEPIGDKISEPQIELPPMYTDASGRTVPPLSWTKIRFPIGDDILKSNQYVLHFNATQKEAVTTIFEEREGKVIKTRG